MKNYEKRLGLFWDFLVFLFLRLLFNSFMMEVSIIIEIRTLICKANQWSGLYMIRNSVIEDLNLLVE